MGRGRKPLLPLLFSHGLGGGVFPSLSPSHGRKTFCMIVMGIWITLPFSSSPPTERDLFPRARRTPLASPGRSRLPEGSERSLFCTSRSILFPPGPHQDPRPLPSPFPVQSYVTLFSGQHLLKLSGQRTPLPVIRDPSLFFIKRKKPFQINLPSLHTLEITISSFLITKKERQDKEFTEPRYVR